jgi:hypothetical protein
MTMYTNGLSCNYMNCLLNKYSNLTTYLVLTTPAIRPMSTSKLIGNYHTYNLLMKYANNHLANLRPSLTPNYENNPTFQNFSMFPIYTTEKQCSDHICMLQWVW